MAEEREVEERIVEAILGQMNKRLSRLENDVGDVRREISQLREEMHGEISQMRGEISQLREEMHGEISQMRGEISQLRAEFHTDFRWLIGFMVGTWITLMLAILFR